MWIGQALRLRCATRSTSSCMLMGRRCFKKLPKRGRVKRPRKSCAYLKPSSGRAPLRSKQNFSKYVNPLGHSVWLARRGLTTTGSYKIHTFYCTRLSRTTSPEWAAQSIPSVFSATSCASKSRAKWRNQADTDFLHPMVQ